MTIYIPEIPGLELEDWVEDKRRFSRFTLADRIEESVWVCTECEQLAENCECGDNLAEVLDLA